MPAAATITLLFLVATVLLLVLAQFTARESRARTAAIASIITILIADYYLLSAVREGGAYVFERPAAARKDQPKPSSSARRNGGDGDRSGTSSSHASSSSSDAIAHRQGSGENARTDQSQEDEERSGSMEPNAIGTRAHALARSFAGWLGSKIDREPAAPGLTRIETFSDCPGCPEMVRIAPGEIRIGAQAGDTSALPAEEPARSMRVWPGFAISRFEISAEQLAGSGLGRSCSTSLVTGSEQTPASLSAPGAPATCVTAGDISNYLAWLKHKTGRRYRLPTAAEWEFAARSTLAAGTGPERMAGGVAEIVADCWSSAHPITLLGTATEQAQRGACAYRIVKDAADAEPVQWRRVSARRAIPANAASPLVGFRIMRDFDLTAAKGF